MRARKAVRVINALIADKRGSLELVERRRWTEQMKEEARRILRDDIAALGLARDVLKCHVPKPMVY